ncbi:MAG: hypothetical protein SGILL_000039 [Bacillariaceae sp.]
MVTTKTSIPNTGGGGGSGDMYRDILKEIGAEEANMQYLFDETSDDDSLLHEEEEPQQPRETLQNLSLSASSSSDEDLLHSWEADAEEIKMTHQGGGIASSATRPSPKQRPTLKSPEWKEMLQEASVQQEELQAQLTNLQMSQRKSSPSNHRRNVEVEQKTPAMEEKKSGANELEQPSDVISPVLKEISVRNAQLQDEWHSQQKQTVELQEKLDNLQSQFHEEQDQWKSEKNELFSPIRSPTRIPRWDPTPSKSSSKVSFVTSPSSSLPRSTNAERNNGSFLKSSESDDLNSSKVDSSLVDDRDERIRELETQLREAKQLQEKQREELKGAKDRLETRDVDYKALFIKYESEKRAWEDTKAEMESEHQSEKESWVQQLESANDLLQTQVELNQEQREELQELKSASWTNELEETQKRIKMAVAQQTEKSEEFKTRIQDLEDRHEEERQSWKTRLESYKSQLEENSAGWERQLVEANDRYADLEDKYLNETKEWQNLLEMDISNIEEEGKTQAIFRPSGNVLVEDNQNVTMSSPIPIDSTARQEDDETASQDSSLQVDSVPSESMEKLDELMDELGQMSAERDAILDEIKADDDENQSKGGVFASKGDATESSRSPIRDAQTAPTFDEPAPKPVETPETSPRNDNELNTTSDSVVLDRTLTLLHGLKEMIGSGDGAHNESTVLESLEMLSELMQDQASYQSMMSSPRRSVQDAAASVHETSLDISRDNSIDMNSVGENDTTWISSVKAAMDPWPALVAELKSRCEFLERDRNELSRITEQIIKMERESHRVEMAAAAATAKREAGEKIHKIEQKCNRQVRIIYKNLCYHCQKKVYAMF